MADKHSCDWNLSPPKPISVLSERRELPPKTTTLDGRNIEIWSTKMKTIALTAAALLVAAGSAFAQGSDHYGSNYTYSNVDSSYTASTQKGSAVSHDLGATVKPVTDGAPRLGGNS
jgi:hypothetical protein